MDILSFAKELSALNNKIYRMNKQVARYQQDIKKKTDRLSDLEQYHEPVNIHNNIMTIYPVDISLFTQNRGRSGKRPAQNYDENK